MAGGNLTTDTVSKNIDDCAANIHGKMGTGKDAGDSCSDYLLDGSFNFLYAVCQGPSGSTNTSIRVSDYFTLSAFD